MIIPIGDNLERPNFPIATVTLIMVNVLIFAFTFRAELTLESIKIEGEKGADAQVEQFDQFYGTWGCAAKSLAEGEVIGLLTHMFLHASIMHLIGNMIILWAFGQSLETALGSFAFIVMYMIWGAIACLSQCMLDWTSETFLIGASGAIAGVIGGYVMLLGYSANIKLLILLVFLPIKFEMPAVYVGAIWFLSQLMNASMDVDGTLSGVAWLAHIGGFAVGVVTMLIYRSQTDRILVRGAAGKLYFHDRTDVAAAREERERAKAMPEIVSSIADGDLEIEIQPRECTACGTVLTNDHLIGACLLRCPNGECSQLTYVSADEMTANV